MRRCVDLESELLRRSDALRDCIDRGGMLDLSIEKLRGLRVKAPVLQFANNLDPLRGIDDTVGGSRRDHRPDQEKRGFIGVRLFRKAGTAWSRR